ncbi:MAG: LysM domain-containing protein [Verrucomicrobiota bacterium]
MKRAFILFSVSIFLLRLPLMAQDATGNTSSNPANTAAAIAAKEDAEERYKRLAADLQAVQSDNEALHAKITAMEEEIQTLRTAQAHSADNSGIQNDLKRLADAIQEVDKKRLEDKEAISEEIRKSIGGLERSLGSVSTPARPSAPKPSTVAEPLASDKGYLYTIQEGDRLDLIVKAYNADFKSKGLKTITLRQAKEANPNVDWNRLRVGQKIVVPRPDGG